MTRNLWTIVATSLLTGCLASPWEGVWFVQMPVLEDSACETSVIENFSGADPFDDGGSTGGPWTYTSESTLSDSAFFVEILPGKKGNVVAVVGDEAYPGTVDGKTLTVSWAGATDDMWSEGHEDGYVYAEVTLGEVEETLTLTRDPSTGGLTGSYAITSSSESTWTETDRWRSDRTGMYYGQIPAYLWLSGVADNLPDTEECDDEECDLAVISTCDGKVDLTGVWAGRGDGLFGGLQDAGQDPGT